MLWFLAIVVGSLVAGGYFQATSSAGTVGINYGQIGNNLPAPDRVVGLLESTNVSKVKLYDSDARVLRAFRNTSVEFVVGIPNEYVVKMTDPAKALAWIKLNVQAYLPETRIGCVTVGNEVLTGNDSTLTANLVPAMQNVYGALKILGLADKIQVTTPHSFAVLSSSYPPSSGSFRKDLAGTIRPLLRFHAKTGSPFLINAYPFFAYMGDPKRISLDYVLFQPNAGIIDPKWGLHYDNMLFAQIDAVYAALEAEGHQNLTVKVSETGWASKGDLEETGATTENARAYNGNLIKILSKQKGTPRRPASGLEVYLFALFNENLKPGPTSERNYGLFKPDGTPAYAVGFDNAKLSPATTPLISSTPFNRSYLAPNRSETLAKPGDPPGTSSQLTSAASGTCFHGRGSAMLLGQGLIGLLLVFALQLSQMKRKEGMNPRRKGWW